MTSRAKPVLTRRVLAIQQSRSHRIYVFTLTAAEILRVADISRLSRSQSGELIGYQRPEVKRHIDNIVEYLDGEDPIFPNAIILALSSAVRFRSSRGPKVGNDFEASGFLDIPLPRGSEPKPGWIVDGQQRALALSNARDQAFPVPVTAFIADTVEVQRDQFLRVNSTRPLPRGLVTELLPEVSIPISKRLSAKKIPSALCDHLNHDPSSPFYQLIRRASTPEAERGRAVVTDTSLINAIEESLNSSSGCLFPYRNVATGETDTEGIWLVLVCYWSAVKATFPDAWGKPAEKSRLMHGVGIRAMGRLMDLVMAPGHVAQGSPRSEAVDRVRAELATIAPVCRWTAGVWEELDDLPWNGLQNVPKHIWLLSNYLVRVYAHARLGAR